MVDKLQRKLSRMEAKAVAVTEEQAQVIASLQQQVATSSQSPVNKIKEMPEVAKYFKLLSMGLPPDQVKMKMQLAGVDPNLLDTPDAPSAKLADDQGAGAAISPTAPAPAPEVPPEYVKYFKLLKMGMPLEQVKLKASADGFDPSKLDNPPPPLASAPTPEDPPEIAKYKKLLKMGMPLAQVQLKMQAEGLNPALLDGGNTTPSNSNSNSNGGPAAKLDLNQLLKKTSSMKKDETASAALPKKDSVKPNVDMRALFWTRIPVNVVQSTVWSSLSDTSVSLEPFDLEWMFRKANPASTVDKDSNEKKKKDSAAVLLLDSKTQQNVGIALARFKLSPSDVKAGLLAMDQTAISVDHLSSLIALAPTLEEQDLLKNYDGPVHVLGAVEKFFLEMLSIPRYTQRIKCFRFSLQFEHRVLEIQAQVDTLSAATDQIADSAKFRRILETMALSTERMLAWDPDHHAISFPGLLPDMSWAFTSSRKPGYTKAGIWGRFMGLTGWKEGAHHEATYVPRVPADPLSAIKHHVLHSQAVQTVIENAEKAAPNKEVRALMEAQVLEMLSKMAATVNYKSVRVAGWLLRKVLY
ncbi:hypothetical protein DYB38_009739, partial [Aphanomyces astaci]